MEIARDLCQRDPDEQRYAVKRFVSCQALGLTAEMREIIDDLSGRRRELHEKAVEQMNKFRELVEQRIKESGETEEEKIQKRIALELHPNAQPDPDEPFKPVLTADERKEMVKWRNLRRYQPVAIEYLRAQVLTAEKRWDEALQSAQHVRGVHMARPGLLLHTAELCRRLNRLDEAKQTYQAALDIDPDNAQAHLGMCRLALRQRSFADAAEHARQALAKLYFFPMAHFLLGVARVGLADYQNAAGAFRVALSQNPHFPQAHLWLGRLLRNHLHDLAAANEHFNFYRYMRAHRAGQQRTTAQSRTAATPAPPKILSHPEPEQPPVDLGPLGEDIVVVSGLPRSGTSMLMQMLAAGGLPILTDHLREADEDNPRGYFEWEAAKKMHVDQSWVAGARGKAVKIVAPLVCNLPVGQKYRVVLMQRDYEEILESQARMISRQGGGVEDSPERRQRLIQEFDRVIQRTRRQLSARPDVHLLVLRYDEVVRDPQSAARQLIKLVGGDLDETRIVAAIDPSLHRNRVALDKA